MLMHLTIFAVPAHMNTQTEAHTHTKTNMTIHSSVFVRKHSWETVEEGEESAEDELNLSSAC